MNTKRINRLNPFRSFSRPARLFLVMILLDGLFFSGWNLFFNFYFLESGYSREFLGLVNAVPSIAMLALGIPMGLLSDRLGRRRAMILGIIGCNLTMIAQVSIHQPTLIVGLGFVWGPLAILYGLSQAPFMMKFSDDSNRDLLFSLSFGMFPLANTVGNLLAGQMPALFANVFHVANRSALAYQATLITSVLLSFSMVIPLVLIREPEGKPADEKEASPDKPKQSIWTALTRPLTVKLALPNLILGFGAALLIPYMNVFFMERFKISDAWLGILFSLSSLLTALACFVGPRLVRNLGSKVLVVVLCQGASLVFLLMIGFAPSIWAAALGFLIRGALMNMAAPLFDAYAMEQTVEKEQGAVNSVRGLAWSIGWAVGPYLSGVVQEQYGFTPLFLTTGLLYLAASLFVWIVFHRRQASLEEAESPTNLSALEPAGD